MYHHNKRNSKGIGNIVVVGWTSDHDPRNSQKAVLRGSPPKTQADENRGLREKLALKYMYTSSTQRYTKVITNHKVVYFKNVFDQFSESALPVFKFSLGK